MTDPTLDEIVLEFLSWMEMNPGITPEDIGVHIDKYVETPHGRIGIITAEAVLNSKYHEFVCNDRPKKEVS